jgi:hypothetical protein
MPPGDGGPADAKLLQTGTQHQKHPGIVTDDRVRCASPRDRLAANLDHTGEMLAIEAPGSHEGPTVTIAQENTIEPVSKPRHEFIDAGAELTRLYPICISSTSNHAA